MHTALQIFEQMAHHRCDIFLKGAMLPGCHDVEMGPANLLQVSVYYSKYNERFKKEVLLCTVVH